MTFGIGRRLIDDGPSVVVEQDGLVLKEHRVLGRRPAQAAPHAAAGKAYKPDYHNHPSHDAPPAAGAAYRIGSTSKNLG